jgi:hypothetical protein
MSTRLSIFSYTGSAASFCSWGFPGAERRRKMLESQIPYRLFANIIPMRSFMLTKRRFCQFGEKSVY